MTHSTEPWQKGEEHEGMCQIWDANKHCIGEMRQSFGIRFPGDSPGSANIDRVLACVNACQGLPVETLESIARGTFYLKPTPIMDEYETIRRHIKSKALGGHMQCVLHPKEWETLVKHHAPDLPPNAYLHIDGITVRPQQHPGDWM